MPAQTPTVPRPWIKSTPTIRPKMVQPIERWREISSSICVGRMGRDPERSPRGRSAPLCGAAPAFRAGASDSASALRRLVDEVSSVTLPSRSTPVVCELSDAGLDLIEGDMTQAPRSDDLLTIYHDVADR